ncbi:MAG: hypothetical protein M1827_007205 [Pycnora praestabilis]|nr:MAG: hypothetical protein M1827_007205 [Pycnora praestabilis]
MDNSGPRIEITADDKGPLVNIAVWIVMVFMVLSVMTRLGTKFIITRLLEWDDALILSAMVFGIGETVAISIQVANGLGRTASLVSAAQLVKFQQAGYAAQMLYIAALACAKVSSLTFLAQLTPDTRHIKTTRVIALLVAVWAFVSILGIAFQCKLPHPWEITSSKCMHQNAFWYFVGAIDVVTDAAIMGMPLFIVWNLQLARARKAIVVGAFSARILVIVATICRLIYLGRASRSSDRTFDEFALIICTQVEVNLSIFASCVPYLKPFLESLESDRYQSSLRPGVKPSTYGYAKTRDHRLGSSYAMETKSSRKSSNPKAEPYNMTESIMEPEVAHTDGRFRPENISNQAVISSLATTPHGHGDHRLEDGDSATSTGSDKMIIKQTREWTVQYEEDWRDQEQGLPIEKP